MNEKIPVTIRLPRSDVVGLDRMATEKATTRQDVIQGLVHEAVAAAGPFDGNEGGSLPPAVLAAVMDGVVKMKSGEETSLKKLIGKELWARLDDPIKRGLGKVFKVLVDKGQFPELKRGRKKSNNEQQYNKS